MFGNIGKKIKVLTIILFVLKCLLVIGIGLAVLMLPSVITGFIESLEFNDFDGETFKVTDLEWYNELDLPTMLNTISMIIAVSVWVIGLLSAWIGSFRLYGYGELIDKTMDTARNTNKMLELMQSGAFQAPAAPMPQAQFAPPPVYPGPAPAFDPGFQGGFVQPPVQPADFPAPPAFDVPETPAAAPEAGTQEASETIRICPACGEENTDGSAFCIKCGMRLD